MSNSEHGLLSNLTLGNVWKAGDAIYRLKNLLSE